MNSLELQQMEAALAVARKNGWTVTVPKSQQATQRQTLVESQHVQQSQRTNPNIYTHGSYLREQLHPDNWRELADRSRPLPAGMNADFALNEMSNFLSAEISERYAQMGTITLI